MRIRAVVVFSLALITIFGILLAAAELPPYGEANNPVHNEVYKRYTGQALQDTGVPNMVTAIVLDYRAYDTMFETIVLFTAALAVVVTLKWLKKEDGSK